MSDGQPATVQELWRFPVKSMQGERIDASEVTSVGLVGDRAYAVVDADNGKVGSAKHPRLWGDLLQCVAATTLLRWSAHPCRRSPSDCPVAWRQEVATPTSIGGCRIFSVTRCA